MLEGQRAPADDDLDLRPLTARSVLLSVLLGTHPPRLAVQNLIRAGELFGIAEGTVRVALSRMAAEGEVEAERGRYLLAERLVARQHRQDEGRRPPTRRWDGAWEMAVVRAERRSEVDKKVLVELRLAELNPGVWTRPANLDRDWPEQVDGWTRRFAARPEGSSAELAGALWDLDGWAKRANALCTAFAETTNPAARFVVSAALLRHLTRDPLLPKELVAPTWPGDALRDAYRRFEEELSSLLSSASASAALVVSETNRRR
ncbi:MAG: PaaX domain-containing protein, C- domain protein [Actinomycetota bacterium]|nr:PaaX domain-containing protein, C- domain protein [Actinomycetota bacterium]